MTTLIILVSVLLLALAALWAYAYWHQTKALKEQCRRLYAAADPVSEVIHASVHMSDAEVHDAVEFLLSERQVRRERTK